ncbi:hypothetical protein HHL17_16220 [Chitinophaga sp. G-6-1-13]|uniref:Uncharacterized protein n=1 Tax=Chitinophaga fulva TaxID=2728842 RepID=A0A848GKB6_9BACT|nr:hypothetical protein [Chitinophaga fulva]NML38756.1 hypothetical protein [Chitinophaga fulva]
MILRSQKAEILRVTSGAGFTTPAVPEGAVSPKPMLPLVREHRTGAATIADASAVTVVSDACAKTLQAHETATGKVTERIFSFIRSQI